MHYFAVWPEAWTWRSENVNITSRVDDQDKRCLEEKLYGKRLLKQLVPLLMTGHRTRGSGPKWAGKTDSCFYLNGGKDHASGLRQGDAGVRDRQLHHQRHIRLPPCPLRRPQVTFGNGVIRAPSPPPAATSMGRSGTGGLVGRSGESDASPILLHNRSHLRRGRETSAFCKVTRAAEGALGGTSPFLHCCRSHRRRKEETPAFYVVNRR